MSITNKFSLETIVHRNDGKILSSELGEEVVMMNIETGDYLNMNIVSAEIWKILKNPISIKNLCEKLSQKFDVDNEVCKADTIEFLKQLEQEDLLNLS